jgi:hypothetical protein
MPVSAIGSVVFDGRSSPVVRAATPAVSLQASGGQDEQNRLRWQVGTKLLVGATAAGRAAGLGGDRGEATGTVGTTAWASVPAIAVAHRAMTARSTAQRYLRSKVSMPVVDSKRGAARDVACKCADEAARGRRRCQPGTPIGPDGVCLARAPVRGSDSRDCPKIFWA